MWGGQRAPPSTRQTDRESSALEGRTEKTRQRWDTVQERVAATAASRMFGDKEAVCSSKVPQSPPNSGPGPRGPLASPSPGHKRTEPTLRKGGTVGPAGPPSSRPPAAPPHAAKCPCVGRRPQPIQGCGHGAGGTRGTPILTRPGLYVCVVPDTEMCSDTDTHTHSLGCTHPRYRTLPTYSMN